MIKKYAGAFICFALSSSLYGEQNRIIVAECRGESLSKAELSRSILTDDVSYFESMNSCFKGAIREGSLSDIEIPFLSAQNNSVEVLSYFVKEGIVSTNAINEEGISIVEIALISGSYGATLFLLKNGSEVDLDSYYFVEGLRMILDESFVLTKKDARERDVLMRYLSEKNLIDVRK